MASLLSPVAGDVTPTQPKAKTKPAKSRPNARRVYGKRKVDAPRAVFDQRSPAKTELKKSPRPAQDSVESIQEKLAEVHIGDGQDTVQEKTIETGRTAEKEEDCVEEIKSTAEIIEDRKSVV